MMIKFRKLLIKVSIAAYALLFCACNQDRVWFDVVHHSQEWIVQVNDDLISTSSYRVYVGDSVMFTSENFTVVKTIGSDLADPYTTVSEDYIIYAYK